ncbi:MAG: hypothetical protein MPJ25_07700 [Pirellulales bacterium]|nr:hypothetical protein [Pirellulales bacterium]
MAEINSQADFDALLQTNEARYEDATNTQFGTTADNFTVTQPGNTVLTTPSLASNDQTITFTADNCFINFTDDAATGGSATDNWLGGTLNITNSTLNYTGGGNENFVWPGFGAAGGNNVNTGQPVNQRYVSNLSNSRIIGAFTLQFQGANIAGHNLTNLDISQGPAPFFLFGMADLVMVFFSGATGQSATFPGAGAGGGPVHLRMDNPVGAGGPTAVLPQQWWGCFACNFTNWTAGPNSVYFNQIMQPGHFLNIGGAGQPALPTFFIVDGAFSPQIVANGFRLGSTSGNFTYVSGVSFRPRFRDNITQVQLTEDTPLDFGTRTIWGGQVTRDFTTLPTETTSAGIQIINDNGYVIENARNTDQSTFTEIAAPLFTGAAMPYWSYSHQSYSVTTGDTNTITPTNRDWVNSFQFADFQEVDLVAEAALNGRNTVADGRALVTDNAGLSTLADAFPAVKSIYYDGREDDFFFFQSTASEFNALSINVVLVEPTVDIAYNTTDLDLSIAGTFDLGGLTLSTTGAISGLHTLTDTANVARGAAPFNLTGNITRDQDILSVMYGNTVLAPAQYVLDFAANTIAVDDTILSPAGLILTVQYNSHTNSTLSNGTLNGNTLELGSLNFGNGIRIDNGVVNGLLSNNVAILGAVEMINTPTFHLTEDIDFTAVTFQGDITLTADTAVTVSVRTGQGITTTDPDVTINVLDAVIDFTNQPHPDGGRFAVLRWNGTAWVQVGTTQSVAANGTATIRSTETGPHMALWRPLNRRFQTHFFRPNDVTLGEIAQYTVNNAPIADTLLYPANLATPTPTITWSTTTINTSMELLGEVDGTTANTAPNASETQFLLLGSYLDNDYLDVVITRILNLGQTTPDGDLISRDIIFPTSPAETAIDGEFVQLDTGAANGSQQFLTSVVGRDINGNDNTGMLANAIVATISGTETGTGTNISFPAVSLLANPAGITVAEVTGAVASLTEPIERGISYTVGTLDANPIIQAPTGTTFDPTADEGTTAGYPDLGE